MRKKNDKILAFGEVLWDMLPTGKKCGGAPGNVAFHCRQLGADVRMLSRVGNDPLGDELLAYWRDLNVPTEMIGTDDSAPTGTVAVSLDDRGQPVYTIMEDVAWDFLEATPAALAWASEADAVCFGSLAARSAQNRKTLETLLSVVKPTALRMLDLNLRDPFCEKETLEFVLSRANALKLNDEELARTATMFAIPGETPQEQMQELIRRYDLRLLIVTCGEHGSHLATSTHHVFTPGVPVQVVDTVGAGDAFTAAAIVGFLNGQSLEEIGQRATTLAGYVCTQSGATPKLVS